MTNEPELPERIWAWKFMKSEQTDVMVGGWDKNDDRKLKEYVSAELFNAQAARIAEYEVRLRELEAELAAMTLDRNFLLQSSETNFMRAEAAGAKLSKVVEELETLMKEAYGCEHLYETTFHAHVYETLSATLAELKDQPNDQ